MELKQYDRNGPKNKPTWMWHNGDMFVGKRKKKEPKGRPVEHGFGVFYNRGSRNVRRLGLHWRVERGSVSRLGEIFLAPIGTELEEQPL